MEKTVEVQPTTDEPKDWEAALKRVYEQMDQADARIRSDQDEIDQLKAETRAILAQLKASIRT
jgi:F0F1-type ATP synthase membrane subunit b/b'